MRLAIGVCKQLDGLLHDRFKSVAPVGDLLPGLLVVKRCEGRMVQSMAAYSHPRCRKTSNLLRGHHLVPWQRYGGSPSDRVRLAFPFVLRQIPDLLQDRVKCFSPRVVRVQAM